jgi:import inner membrane translocase subunit TIM23
MYSPLRSGLAHFREVDDGLNSIAAATITGLIYKSTGGIRAMVLASTIGCVGLGLYTLTSYYVGGNYSLLFT